jgi:glyoxylase-like metal-dependent hydrolase (beta-lactamase superfamily II)
MEIAMHRALLAVLLLLASPLVAGANWALHPVKVADGVYAVIGALEGQTYENDGLSFVIGGDGVLVINTGPSTRVATALHRAIRAVTDKPVKWVVNTNSQNHYWHGNEYFRQQGAQLFAQQEAVRLMRELGPGQLEDNRNRLKERAARTALAFPKNEVDRTQRIELGDRAAELKHFSPAHTAGDLVVWLPSAGVLFSGDIIYVDRMLAVIPISSTAGWIEAFDATVALSPKVIVPGHGKPTDIVKAKRETRDYLVLLRESARKAVDNLVDLNDFVNNLDQSKFKHLANFDELARRNANMTYVEMMKEAF